TATVTTPDAAAGVPTGAVRFMDDLIELGTAAVGPDGRAVLSAAGLATGDHPLTAEFLPNGDFLPSRSPAVTESVLRAGTTTALSSSANPAPRGTAVTFTAVVAAVAPGAGLPTGTVGFFDGATLIGSAPLAAGAAALTTSALSVGTHSVTAAYLGDGDFDPSTGGPVAQVVVRGVVAATLSAAPNPAAFGQAVTLSATVDGTTFGGGTPTGTVTFVEGATVLGTAALDQGTATLVVTGLAVGDHPIAATYGGDLAFAPAVTGTVVERVVPAGTATSLASSANPSLFGRAVTFTATVGVAAPGGGTPAGTVTFYDGATPLGASAVAADVTATALASSANPSVFGQPVTLTATVTATGGGTPAGTVTFADAAGGTLGSAPLVGGVATLTTAALEVGTHPVTASYAGSPGMQPSASAPLDQVVQKAATATAVATSLTPSSYGQSVTLTATVTATAGGAGAPDGSVTFYDGPTALGTATLAPDGTATLTTAGLAAGAHPITAAYAGDAHYAASTSAPLAQAVARDGSATGIRSSLNPSRYGEVVTFTADVAALAPGNGLPTGDVTFYEGTTVLGTGHLSAGRATFTTSRLSVLSHAITAAYAGDAHFTPSASDPLVQQVDQDETTVSLSSSVNPSAFGQAVAFTATVSSVAQTGDAPGGVVTFRDGSTVVGTAALDAAGRATFTTSTLATGTHPIIATYGGDATFVTSVSAALAQRVDRASVAVALASSANPSELGQAVTFTAAVTAAGPGAGLPGGTVTFRDGSTVLGTATLDETGAATLSTSALAVGTHAVTATYSGDANFLGGSAAVSQVVSKAATATTVTSSPNPSAFGQAVTLTAVVATPAGTAAGTVTFYDGTVALGTATLVGGTATLTTAGLAVGTHPISAGYAGSANHVASTS
ncbi:MAG TPA: Ig-like domain-containing protein, partial [Humisphaera sp.]